MMVVTEAMKPQTRSRLEAVLAATPDPIGWAAAGVRRQQQRARFAARVAQARQWKELRRG